MSDYTAAVRHRWEKGSTQQHGAHNNLRPSRGAGPAFAGWGGGEEEVKEEEVKEEVKEEGGGGSGLAAPRRGGSSPPRCPGTSLSAGRATRRCPRWWREGCACVGSSGTGARGRCVLAAGRAGPGRAGQGRAGGGPGPAAPAPLCAAGCNGLMRFSAAPGPKSKRFLMCESCRSLGKRERRTECCLCKA